MIFNFPEFLAGQHSKSYQKDFENDKMLRFYASKSELSVLHLDHWDKYPLTGCYSLEITENYEFLLIHYHQSESLRVKLSKVPSDVFVLKPAHIEKVLQQMKESGKNLCDEEADYYEGIGRYYCWNKKENSFQMEETDTVVLSFHRKKLIEEQSMKEELMKTFSLFGLRSQGFDLPYIN